MPWVGSQQTDTGYPADMVQPGKLIQVGGGGPTKVGDYAPHRLFAPDGSELKDPNQVIPAGASLSFDAPPTTSPTGGQVVTGTQIPLDAETIRSSQDSSAIAHQNANTSAAAQAATAAYQTGSLGVSQGQLALAQQTAADAKQQAAQQYELDKAKFGETVASRLFNERVAQATLNLQAAQFGLSQQQFNASQRQDKARQTQSILGMLADRSGPDDPVGYSYLLRGQSAPDSQGKYTVNPLKMLDDLYQPATGAAPNLDVRANMPANASAPATIPLGASSPPAGTPGGATSTPPPSIGSSWQQAPQGATSGGGVISTNGNGYTYDGPGADPTAQPQGDSGMTSWIGQFARRNAAPKSGGDGTSLGRGLQMFEHGGQTRRPMAVVGDSSTGRENRELVINLNPDPKDKIAVIPLSRIPHAMDGGTVTPDGMIPLAGPVSPPSPRPEESMMGDQSNDGGSASEGAVGAITEALSFLERSKKRDSNVAHALVSLHEAISELSPAKAAGSSGPGMIPLDGSGDNLPMVPHAETGGVYGGQYNTNDMTFRDYGADAWGGLPYLRSISGTGDALPTFGGFGARLANPRFGITDAPFNINLARYSKLLDTEQKGVQNIYGKGLGVNFNDVLKSSRAAAPVSEHPSIGASSYSGRRIA